MTSAEEALRAQEGGADCLELAHSLQDEGLTPSSETVREATQAVSIPVRVLLRDVPSMEMHGEENIALLLAKANAFAGSNIDGLVIGFVRHGALDAALLTRVLEAAPNVRATFHRAFEHVLDPLGTIQQLKQFPQIDRILTNGGDGSWQERTARLLQWQKAAAPEMKIVVGGGLTADRLSKLACQPTLTEFHVGRAARNPCSASGTVDPAHIASLKSVLA